MRASPTTRRARCSRREAPSSYNLLQRFGANDRNQRLGLAAIEHHANLLRVLGAFLVAGHQLDLLRTAHPDLQLHGAGNLLLIKDRALAHFWCGPEVAEQSNTHGINS